jgi:hypothetical protein
VFGNCDDSDAMNCTEIPFVPKVKGKEFVYNKYTVIIAWIVDLLDVVDFGVSPPAGRRRDTTMDCT